MVGSIVGTNNPLKGEVMGSVNVNRCLENGKVLNTIIMQTIRTAVAEHIERRVKGLLDVRSTVRIASLHRLVRHQVIMTNVPRDEWSADTWIYVETCLDNMPDGHANACYKQAALDYANKRLERLAYE